jgi:nucleotide-binding universal stress UspA family protein
MGSHGRTGLKRMLLGSIPAKVIGHAPCAVMVIPPPAS